MTRYKKTCNRGCGQEIELTDETGSGWLPFNLDGSPHVCQETKAKNRIAQGAKNNHGNEESRPIRPFQDASTGYVDQPKAESPKEMHQRMEGKTSDDLVSKGYVDYTLAAVQPQKLKLKVLTDPTPDGLSLAYNSFAKTHNIKYSQYQPVNALYTIAVWFEEVPLKQ